MLHLIYVKTYSRTLILNIEFLQQNISALAVFEESKQLQHKQAQQLIYGIPYVIMTLEYHIALR
jgi:hypothetical protein